MPAAALCRTGCLFAGLDAPLCSIQLGDKTHDLLLSPKGYYKAPAAAALRLQPCHALPSSLQGQGPLAACRDVAGLELHCRQWLRKRGRMQSRGVRLEKGFGSKSCCDVWSGRSQPGAGLFSGAAGADTSAVFRSPALQQRLTVLSSGREAVRPGWQESK